MKLNEDYELIPGAGENWDIRILTGEFVETVLNFSKLQVTEDGENLAFNFDIVSSPDPSLKAGENIDLQNTAGMILSNILEEVAEIASEKAQDK
ncbi:hypothetical protein N9B98_04330 [bacterium]|nr:hypothetical protein [bacterium]